jgi:hypothetical protein
VSIHKRTFKYRVPGHNGSKSPSLAAELQPSLFLWNDERGFFTSKPRDVIKSSGTPIVSPDNKPYTDQDQKNRRNVLPYITGNPDDCDTGGDDVETDEQ